MEWWWKVGEEGYVHIYIHGETAVNASLVGANTVNGPVPCNAVTNPASVNAPANVVRFCSNTISTTVVCDIVHVTNTIIENNTFIIID